MLPIGLPVLLSLHVVNYSMTTYTGRSTAVEAQESEVGTKEGKSIANEPIRSTYSNWFF